MMTVTQTPVKSRPIIFSGARIHALLNTKPGVWPAEPIDPKRPYKWQTRRAVVAGKLKPGIQSEPLWHRAWTSTLPEQVIFLVLPSRHYEQHSSRYIEFAQRIFCPYGEVGDQLWMKETIAQHKFQGFPLGEIPQENGLIGRIWSYDVDGIDQDSVTTRRSSMFMPRWASRITLEIKNVRVQRVRDMSEEDAIAEGLKEFSKDGGITWKWGVPDRDGLPGTDDVGMPWHRWRVNPIDAFSEMWFDLHGNHDENQWVWAIDFMRVK